jgi:hypothetical protein
MPGEVPYTSQLPYLVHPAMKTHPSFVPPTDGSMIQGASPLYANFVPPTQVGGYAGTNQGYAGNTYLPDQQAPISNQSGGTGLVDSTAAYGSMLGQMGGGNAQGQLGGGNAQDPLSGMMGSMGMGMMGSMAGAGMGQMNIAQMSQIQQLRLMQARALASQQATFSLAPNDQNFVQASGQQNLMMGHGNFYPRPLAMQPQDNWFHSQPPDRTPHLSTPVGMAPGTMSHAQPTTFVNVYQVPSGLSLVSLHSLAALSSCILQVASHFS